MDRLDDNGFIRWLGENKCWWFGIVGCGGLFRDKIREIYRVIFLNMEVMELNEIKLKGC